MLLDLEFHKKFDHIARLLSNIHTNTWGQKCKTTIGNLVFLYIFPLYCTLRSLLTIKRPVLLNDLVWIFPKSFYQTTRSISAKMDCIVLSTYLLTVSIKSPGVDIWKKSLLNNNYYLFLVWPGLLIETLEYFFGKTKTFDLLGINITGRFFNPSLSI